MTALAWPPLLISCAPDVYYDARTVSGGMSISGQEQIAARDFGIWRAALGQLHIMTDATRRPRRHRDDAALFGAPRALGGQCPR